MGLALALLVALAPRPALAEGDLSRDALLQAIERESERRDWKALRGYAEEFLERFGEKDAEAAYVLFHAGEARLRLGEARGAADAFRRALERERDPRFTKRARYFLGVALAEAGDDEEAERTLVGVAADPDGRSPLPGEALYALGQLRIRRGDVALAREALEGALERAQTPALRKRAERDLTDLARIGVAAPPLAGLETPTATATVVAFARSADMAALEAEVGAAAAGARIVRVEVAGWEDPQVRTWAVPTLPRVYVLDASGRIRAVGVRGRAIAAAVVAATKRAEKTTD
jgi:tetratricopeptide (TPR) repeat protein